MVSAMQSLCKKRPLGSLDDPTIPFAPVTKQPRLTSMSDPPSFPTVRPHAHSSPGPEPAARHNRHICSTCIAMANWRARLSPTDEPDMSRDCTLPVVDEEPETDELLVAPTTPVASLVPVPSEPPSTGTPRKSSNSGMLSDPVPGSLVLILICHQSVTSLCEQSHVASRHGDT